ncbi:uncharacterized protein [Halyomorpha halys]|uniref:uncharacterized protein isoform X2 n=1 Tax=Halyomorpha halys TaxID=286706 RepID=UPI0006D4CDB7|nr:uncharacterized protein LOC106689314 isoform X2 [Halyomorpha halys]
MQTQPKKPATVKYIVLVSSRIYMQQSSPSGSIFKGPSKGLNERWFVKVQHRKLLISIAVFFAFTFWYLFLALQRNSNLCRKRQNFCNCNLIVPDIIHFYRSEKEVLNISKSDGVCIKAAGRFHENVWIHTTAIESTSHQLKNLGLTSSSFKVLQAPYGPGPVHLNILRKYGGIFLKNDIYLLSRLDQMRGHDWSSAGEDDIVAGTKDGITNGIQFKLKEILFDKNYGALFIKDLVQNCTYSAVRLGLR